MSYGHDANSWRHTCASFHQPTMYLGQNREQQHRPAMPNTCPQDSAKFLLGRANPFCNLPLLELHWLHHFFWHTIVMTKVQAVKSSGQILSQDSSQELNPKSGVKPGVKFESGIRWRSRDLEQGRKAGTWSGGGSGIRRVGTSWKAGRQSTGFRGLSDSQAGIHLHAQMTSFDSFWA